MKAKQSVGEHEIAIFERWEKNASGAGYLFERYYIDQNGEKVQLPITTHEEIIFRQFKEPNA